MKSANLIDQFEDVGLAREKFDTAHLKSMSDSGCRDVSRDAMHLLETGIVELSSEADGSDSVALVLLAAAAQVFDEAGDVINASVARQWLDSAQSR